MIIALDPGYGNTKVVINGVAASIQSAVAKPVDLGLAATGMRTAKRCRELAFGSHQFVVGDGAWRWGEPMSNMDYSALSDAPRKALFYAALSQILPPGKHTAALMVIGLPVPLLQDAAQAKLLLAGLRQYKGRHAFQADGEAYHLTIEKLKVLAQPVGAYADWLLSSELQTRKGGKAAEIAVMDIGMNTLDLYVVQGGKVLPRYVGGGKVGVRRLLVSMNGKGEDIEELDARLRSRRSKATAAEKAMWLSSILATVEQAWPKLTRFTSVIPTGGGAVVLDDALRTALIAKGAAIAWPEDPITANALGLEKWGRHVSRRS